MGAGIDGSHKLREPLKISMALYPCPSNPEYLNEFFLLYDLDCKTHVPAPDQSSFEL